MAVHRELVELKANRGRAPGTPKETRGSPGRVQGAQKTSKESPREGYLGLPVITRMNLGPHSYIVKIGVWKQTGGQRTDVLAPRTHLETMAVHRELVEPKANPRKAPGTPKENRGQPKKHPGKPKRIPRAAQGSPKGTPGKPKRYRGDQKKPKGSLRGAHGRSKGAQGEPQGV